MNNDRLPHVSGTESRAGEKSGVVRYVLGISLVLIVVLFALLLLLWR